MCRRKNGRMSNLEALKIDLKGLKDDVTNMSFQLSDDYFAAIEGPEVKKGNVDVALVINKLGSDGFKLAFNIAGSITIQCDRCLDDMEQDIDTEGQIIAKFGDEYSEDDEYVIVSEDDGVLDVAWLIYEFIALNIPIQHVHAPGKCNRAMTERLEELSAARSSDAENRPIDPRWSELEKLKFK